MTFCLPRLVLLAGFSLALSAGHTMAQDDETPKYSIEDVKACSRDAIRLCKSKIARISAIEACMRAHYSELSPACQARFAR